MVTADGAVIDHDIPGPERNGVPFFDFETFLSLRPFASCGFRGLYNFVFYRTRILHFHVSHVVDVAV